MWNTYYVICCFSLLAEKCTRLCISSEHQAATTRSSFSVGHIKSDRLRLSNHHVIPLPPFCSQFFCHSFQWRQIANSMKPGHHFKHHADPYHYRRSFLIGSPLSSLSSAPLHEPHKGTTIHHTPNLFCHFSFEWKIKARGPYWFYKKHEAGTPEVECLPVIDNWSNNHDRQEEKKEKKRNTHLGLTLSEGDISEKWLWFYFNIFYLHLKFVFPPQPFII